MQVPNVKNATNQTAEKIGLVFDLKREEITLKASIKNSNDYCNSKPETL